MDDRSRDYGRMLMNFGRAGMFSGNLDSALNSQKNAIAVLENVEDPNGVADAQNNLGQTLIRLRRFDEAREPLRAALGHYERAHDVRGTSSALHHLGLIALERAQLSDAQAMLERALSLRVERRLNDEAAETAYALARLAARQGNTDDAVSHAQKALSLVQSVQEHVLGDPLRRSYFSNKHKYAEFYFPLYLG